MRVTGKRAAVGRVQVREVGGACAMDKRVRRLSLLEAAGGIEPCGVPGKGLVGARRSIFHGEGVAHS